MEQLDRDNFRLSTGRTFYANAGIIGISPDDTEDGDQLSHGYDGGIDVASTFAEDDDNWTLEERRELADYMIATWTRWRDAQISLDDRKKSAHA